MALVKLIGLTAAIGIAGVAAGGWYLNSRDQTERRSVWEALLATREADPPRYDPAMVEGLPEIAQRYFARTISPGTPLHRLVRLDMEGTFVLNGKPLPMTARQILAPPNRGLVWEAEIGAGLMRFAGSDGFYAPTCGPRQSWTKFALLGVVPLARIGGTEDHARAAATRAMLESIWVPASLLPQYGATWVQTGPDSAEISFDDALGLPPMQITLDAAGDLIEVWSLRWTDANPEKIYRLQPFGGRMLEASRFEGFRIPVQVELGNHWGTPAYAPFFHATITSVRYAEF